MFSIDTKSIGIALALAVLLGALGTCGWYLKKLLVERETCKASIEAQNKAILEQNLATETYIENLEKSKEAIAQKYKLASQHAKALEHTQHTHHAFTPHPTHPTAPTQAHACAQQKQELEQIQRDLNVFRGGR
ncbi:hypothetical protein NHP190012_11600 [Helicobacter sp. NHP19-012]|uniref:DUF3552 domain-containing protein n=1 Tax=Helicobacter gastrofelis TaxID=2849642 RepID=A0ABN6I7E0_9HELI|nr:hypothetical protein [Helicobacter sp. NHP19-012]BCZ19518.1 hypothetical protein NHP190012_11600 [Helicobacter sp. NHP19-012]